MADVSAAEGFGFGLTEEAIKAVFDAMIDACKVGAGAIVGGIFSIIAAVVAVVPVFVCKD